jgi:hypothetical protein
MMNEPGPFKITSDNQTGARALASIARDIEDQKIPAEAVMIVWSLAVIAWKEYEEDKKNGFKLKGGYE